MKYIIVRFLPYCSVWARSLNILDKMKVQLRLVKVLMNFMLILTFTSCKKLVQIEPPTSSITTSQVFRDSADANSAIMGIYSSMINNTNPLFISGAVTIDCGLSSDELIKFVYNADVNQLYTNTLQVTNGTTSQLWSKAYPIIYRANACIEGLQSSSGITQSTKNQFIGEAKFIRALCYFYLVNLFGDVPYITSIEWGQTLRASRTTKEQIFNNIVSDLKEAQSLLPSDYSLAAGERIRANQASATALLARIYLYTGDFAKAEAEASSVINNTAYSLASDLNDVFLKNSSEAILQLGLNPANSSIGNLTPEGYAFVPNNKHSRPNYYLTSQLLNDFEIGDQRRLKWVSSTTYSGTVYYYPYKYKNGAAQYSNAAGSATEYYMVLRLGEQYLIRAEAEANSGAQQNLSQAIADLNLIRNRAGLPDYLGPSDRASVLNAIMHERQIELFAEWGNRWFDLKRTGQVDAVMSIVIQQKNGGVTWHSYQQLYPIPQVELSLDPNLTQNPGY